MRCAWQSYLNILPLWMRKEVDMHGNGSLQELRLRTGLPPELVFSSSSKCLKRVVTYEDIQFVINCASQYSPWTATTMADGYITAAGGHRIGICGHAVVENGMMRGIREPTSLCIRVARDFNGIANNKSLLTGSVLILGPPGSGKTTFLRDLVRQRSGMELGSISVIDERGELFPVCTYDAEFFPGKRTDILRFCRKPQGIITVLKTMGPCCIAVDEITCEEDCAALQQAALCGVTVIGTVHASDIADLSKRCFFNKLLENKTFQRIVIMKRDKTWFLEEVPQ